MNKKRIRPSSVRPSIRPRAVSASLARHYTEQALRDEAEPQGVQIVTGGRDGSIA